MQLIKYSWVIMLCIITTGLYGMQPEEFSQIWITAWWALNQPKIEFAQPTQSKKKAPKKTDHCQQPKKQKQCQRKWNRNNRVHQPQGRKR